ncbi:MAG: polysaccharide deacetylase family protein [Candidatus Scalinduaceae bacterium]
MDLFKNLEFESLNSFLSCIEQVINTDADKLSEMGRNLFLTWDDIKSMYWDGITFGAHTMNHVTLTCESLDSAREEIVKSKRIIEDETGREVRHFSYPNGRWNAKIKKIVMESFLSACTTEGGFVSKGSDAYGLNRIGLNEEMITDLKGNFSKYMFTFSIFIETLKKSSHHDV